MKRRRLASAAAAAIAIPALGLGLNGAASARTISVGFYALLGDAVPMTATRRMLPNELAP
jgi:hypothetical protein